MRKLVCVVPFIALACSSSKTSNPSQADAGGAPDGSAPGIPTAIDGSALDGPMARSDAAWPACGSAGVTCTARQAASARTVVPTSSADLAIDLDGDGRPDNQYGRIVQALRLQGYDLQAAQDALVGQPAILVDEASIDPTFTNDPGSALGRLLHGIPQTVDADGGATPGFTVDVAAAPAVYQGSIASGLFASPAAPAVASAPVISLPLALLGTVPVTLPLYAAHLIITNAGGRPVSAQINGAWRAADVQAVAFPALAASLTASVAASPTSVSAQQTLQLFDVGNGSGGACSNADGSKGLPNDGVIATCEVAGNVLMQSLFAPDVQLFDATGAYHPTPGGMQKDSLSVGIVLTLVAARF